MYTFVRHRLIWLFFIAASLGLSQSTWGASARRALQLDDLHRIQSLSQAQLSKDGTWVAYIASTHQLEHDATQSRIWVVRYDGTGKQPLNAVPHSHPKESQWALQWGPDHTLYYLSDRDDNGPQVWRQAIGATAPEPLTHHASGISDFAVSPDGKRLALIIDDARPPVAEGKPAAPVVTERFQFMDGNNGRFLDHRRQHLYVADIRTGAMALLTPGAHDEWLPSWSPDSKTIAYVSKRGTDPDRHSDFNLFTIEALPHAQEKQVTDYPGSDLDPYWESRPAWSPDGKRIAYLRSGEPQWLAYAPAQLAVVELASGTVTLPAQVDRFFYQPQWSEDGRFLYALREEAQAMHVVRVELAENRLTELTSGQRYDSHFHYGAKGRIVITGNDATAPAEVFAWEGSLRPLSQANRALMDQLDITKPEELRYHAKDGTSLHALLLKPAGYQKGQRYPTIVRLHGGPVYQFSHEFMFEWQWYAAQGYAVLGINPRGSSGRGLDFSRAIYADWGKLDVEDVLAGVDHLVKLGIADPQRLGVGGHSYGSILTNYVIASDTRFKAATSSSGSSNVLAMYGLDMYAREYEIELGTPWAKPELYAKLSYPFLHADRIQTPTLFLCGADDFNVPCAGAKQMYQALRSQNIPTRFIRFPQQGHTLDVPSYLAFRLQQYRDWYQRFLK